MRKRSYEKIEKTCLTCYKKFMVTKSREETAKYCSKECHNNKSQFFIECKKCGKTFRRTSWQKKSYVGEYCSKGCYHNREDDIFVKCDGCQKEIKIYPSQQRYYDNHYCSNKCRIKFGPIGKLTEDTIVDNNYHKFVRKVRHCSEYYEWRNNVKSKDSNKCVECGSSEKITVHHKYITMYDFIKKYGFNKEDIYKDNMFFDVNNGETLCRKCHAKKHRK